MPKDQRISRTEFASMDIARARRFHGAFFTLSVASQSPDSPKNKPKFACVVSKKVSNRAVDRNRIRRVVKEICRTVGEGISSTKTLIFYAKKDAKTADFKTIDADIRTLLQQV